MNPFKALQCWIDRDWEKRGYNSTFAFAQDTLSLSPLLLLGISSLVVDITPGSSVYYWSFGISLALCFLIWTYQSYRWLKGYVRPSWHEEQARKRRERASHRQ